MAQIIPERLKLLRKTLGYSQKKIAEILGIQQNAYSYIENGKASMTDRNFSALKNATLVNPMWLAGDVNSEMFTNSAVNKAGSPASVQIALSLAKQFYLSPALSNTPKKRFDTGTRPRIPLTAAAGSLSNSENGVTLADCEQLPIIHQFPAYDFTMFIKGDSMSPLYESGDEIACRKIDQARFVQWGKPHVLDTTQGIIVKRVYEDGDKIRCVSYNPNYVDFSIPKEDVHSMSLVVGSLNISEM